MMINSTFMADNVNNSYQGFTSIVHFYGTFAPTALCIDRIATPIFYLIGIPTNPLCAYIWLGKKTRQSNPSAIYLGALSISHTVVLILHIFIIELNYAWDIQIFHGFLTCEMFYTLYMWPQYLAPMIVLGFTVERYIAICHPFVKEKCCTVSKAVTVVLTLIGFCFLLSCVQAYMWTYDHVMLICNHRPHLQEDTAFVELWNWTTELGVFGVAPLTALVLNVLVIREIRRITNRGPAAILTRYGNGHCQAQNTASTITLLSVSFYLICTWLPATILYLLEREFPFGNMSDLFPLSNTWRRHFAYYTLRKCMEEVTLSNSACYFFIYYFTGKYFRQRFKEVVVRCKGLRFQALYMLPIGNQRSNMYTSDVVEPTGVSKPTAQYTAIFAKGETNTCAISNA